MLVQGIVVKLRLVRVKPELIIVVSISAFLLGSRYPGRGLIQSHDLIIIVL